MPLRVPLLLKHDEFLHQLDGIMLVMLVLQNVNMHVIMDIIGIEQHVILLYLSVFDEQRGHFLKIDLIQI